MEMSLNEYLSIGTIVSIVAFFLKDLFYGHKKNTTTIGDLASATNTAVATLAKLEATIGTLQNTVHDLELTVATMSSNFITKSDHSISIARLHERIDSFKDMMLTGERKAVRP